MTTDTAQVYKAKLIEITKKINDIEALGFNVNEINNILNHIVEKNKISINNSKKNSFEGFIINDYTNAINELTKLDSLLDNYDIYFKAYNYAMYISSVPLNEANVDKIKEELVIVLKGLRNSSNIDYEDEKMIIEATYEAVYKVICYEIENYGQSELYNYCNNFDTDKLYLHEIIKREISKLDLHVYPEITEEIYNIQKNGLNTNYFNIELLRKVIYRDRKEQLLAQITERTNEILELYEKNMNEINLLSKSKDINEEKYQSIKMGLKKNYFKLAKRLVSTILTISIPFASYHLFKKMNMKSGSYDKDYYHTIDYVYNSYTDKVIINEKEKEEVNNTTKACVLDTYSEIVGTNKGYRDRESYDLSFLGYGDIKDYIDYYNTNPDIVPYRKDRVEQVNLDINVKESYYELVYKYIDEESKVIETDIEEANKDALFFTLISSGIIFLFLGIPFGYNIDCIFKLLDSNKIKKSSIKEIKKKLLYIDKQLLKIIGENEELKLRFNNEVQKYPELINKIALPNKDVKILSKKKM